MYRKSVDNSQLNCCFKGNTALFGISKTGLMLVLFLITQHKARMVAKWPIAFLHRLPMFGCALHGELHMCQRSLVLDKVV